ncbi:DNA repair protein RadA [Chamaesiphon sp. OTE_75_metabat_556]|uniref:DNA repair protein RadA n=1 Tax=Chamaesiphon sp. OTE_75_metabat_556 TaxID=2964692 RepID=UPI00286C9A73|nr:DNA repair protein RadA [Chamaesiphon sp. OTE_75_metabat_556]
MAKQPRTSYVCNECGSTSLQFYGKCPICGVYASMVEQAAPSASRGLGVKALNGRSSDEQPHPLAALTFPEIIDGEEERWASGFGELDRVLGGGIVPGSLVLIGGDPGIGKSTLLLQTANLMSKHYRVLYVCGEESGKQVKLRASRLGVEGTKGELTSAEIEANGANGAIEGAKQLTVADGANLYVQAETDLEEILRELESLKPHVAVIDSIQTVYFPALTSAAGSVAQVRECTAALMKVAKREDITLLIVGHVTKEGAIAGPKVLEHLVDTVLYFEGDRFASHRLLRSTKNRFGATHEVGVFEMVDRGLREVDNPSELFVGDRQGMAPGTSIVVACEGTRPIVVELQALVSPTSYPSPRRAGTGIDYNRLTQILAVLEKRVGIPLSKLDAYVASAGGLNVSEPAVDLGMAIAIVASFRDRVVAPFTVLIGEIGLGGQVRQVSQLELRLKEAAKLGFKRAIVPKGHQTFPDLGMEIIPVNRVIDAIVAALPAETEREDIDEE